jgi:uncharacterized protein
MPHANVRRRRSGIHRWGLYATRDLSKGERVVEYTGDRVSKTESDRRADRQLKRGRLYMFELNQRVDLDGDVPGNVAKYANHSCDGNCETDVIRGRVWILARRPIRAGDEITYDYNLDFDPPPQRCRCGTAKCRGWIVASSEMPKLRRWLERNGHA